MNAAAALRLTDLAVSGVKSLHPDQVKISVGMATCGRAAGAEKVYAALQSRIESRGLEAVLSQTGCLGCCGEEPLVEVRLPGGARLIYNQVTQGSARRIVDQLAQGRPPAGAWAAVTAEENWRTGEVRRLPAALPEIIPLHQQPFFAGQRRVVLHNCGLIDPDSLGEALARGAYSSLGLALASLSPEQVIDMVLSSGLRGRGGGGFPTGRKWAIARAACPLGAACPSGAAPGQPKYLICNGDEGDPGAYMDRTLLESDPHSVIEGMLIGAYAVGAGQGYLYVRAEYPLAAARLEHAIAQARAAGLLGAHILGSDFSFELELVRGAGAFVCGEETALIASIEGGLGEPRPKPPYPAECGLWGQPTVINNVKTWAAVPLILARGPEWFVSLGAPGNAGTVIFSLVGQAAHTGLVEAPMGVTLRALLDGPGGGSAGGRALKAVQTGGPSGGCLPAALFDTPITYENMKAAGSILGSGGLVALDESACMVDVARYFLEFTAQESCGKCTACREGSRQMLAILERLTHGQGAPEDLPLLEELAHAVQAGSLCGLGQTAPNPVLSTLRYFRAEYEAHALEHVCPAGKCELVG